MHPLEQYLAALAQSRASGATLPETSGYLALANLLNALGSKLKPKVLSLSNLRTVAPGFLMAASSLQTSSRALRFAASSRRAVP